MIAPETASAYKSMENINVIALPFGVVQRVTRQLAQTNVQVTENVLEKLVIRNVYVPKVSWVKTVVKDIALKVVTGTVYARRENVYANLDFPAKHVRLVHAQLAKKTPFAPDMELVVMVHALVMMVTLVKIA
jgi:hypothetical protein